MTEQVTASGLLTPDQLADLGRSGLNREAINELRIRPASTIELESCGLRPGSPETLGSTAPYVIPYFYINGVPAPHYRIKVLHETEKGTKYRQPANSQNWIYFPPGFTEVSQNAPFILVTEGEKKAAAATQWGFPAVALGGVDSWRSRTFELTVTGMKAARNKSDEEIGNKIIVKLSSSGNGSVKELESGIAKGLTELADYAIEKEKTLFITFDTDLTEAPFIKPEVQRAAADLAFFFRTESAVPLRLIKQLVLPIEGADKVGLDDYLLAEGADELFHLVKEAMATAPGLLYPRRPELKQWMTKQLNSGRLGRDGIEKIAISVVAEMDARGRRLRSPDNRFYYFDSERKRVIPATYVGNFERFVPDAGFSQFLYTYYGLRSRDLKVKEGIIDAFTAEDPIETVSPHRGIRVGKSEVDLQISDSRFIRANADGLTVCDNGTDGTLFLSDQVESLNVEKDDLRKFTRAYDKQKDKVVVWHKVFQELKIEPFPGVSKEETLELLAATFYISPWLNRWKGTQVPLEIATAEAGSGKSSLYSLRLTVLTGRPELQNVPQDLRDWYAAISEAPGMWVGDNVRFTGKDMRQRLSDELCRLTTEPDPHVTLRKLYTTSERARIPINSAFALTSIYPPFQSADLQQRSLVIKFKAIPEGERQSNWLEHQLTRFGGRQSWVFYQLLALRDFFRIVKTEWDDSYRSYNRLANYEQAVILMAKVLGLKSVTQDVLKRLAYNAPEGGDDATMEGLKEFAHDRKPNELFAAGEVVEWAEQQEDYKQDNVLISSRKIGRYIRAHEYDVQKYAKIVPKRGANRTLYFVERQKPEMG